MSWDEERLLHRKYCTVRRIRSETHTSSVTGLAIVRVYITGCGIKISHVDNRSRCPWCGAPRDCRDMEEL